ncbi:hypothetical protein Efla_006696 [Eimeria flavescens]
MQRDGEDRSPKRLRAGDACAASLPPAEALAVGSGSPAAAAVQQQQEAVAGVTSGPGAAVAAASPPDLAAGTIGSLLSLHAQFHCDVCGADISGAFRIRCAECPDFDLCLPCFCSGRTSSSSSSSSSKQQQHKNSHAYIPIGRNRFPVFSLDWTAEEELLLVEGVSKFGFGNWMEVAELVCQASLERKTPEQCEKHYMGVYLNSAAAPLPDLSTLIHGPEGGALTQEEVKARREAEAQTKTETEMAGGSSSPTPQARKSPKPSHSIVGYWPLRGDFDVEFDNDAELILADMEFKAEGEAAQERQLKLQIIEVYNSKLDERIYRKNTIISRRVGLLDIKSLHLRDKKRTKEERELHNLFKPLARFQSDEQQERLVQLLIEEKRVRSRLALLHEWRSLGLKTAKEVEMYEEEKAWREQLRTRSPDLCLSAAATGTIHAAAAAATVAAATTAASAAAGGSSKPQLTGGGKGRAAQRGSVAAAASAAATSASPAASGVLTPIKAFPGAKLLKAEELAFCEAAQLPPVFFLLTKRLLLHEVAQRRRAEGREVNKPVQMVLHRVGQLYDFYVNMWQFAGGSQGLAAAAEGDNQAPPPQQLAATQLLPQCLHPAVSKQLAPAAAAEHAAHSAAGSSLEANSSSSSSSSRLHARSGSGA